MTITTNRRRIGALARRGAALVLLGAGLAACNTTTDTALEGIGFREARFQEVTAMRDYRQCRDEALELDKQARAGGSSGGYLTSARLLEKCESTLGPDVAGIAVDERMRAYALAVQDYIKGGDMQAARRTFDNFKGAFPNHDIYYPDGSSFIVTMEALLGRQDPWSFGQFAALNVNSTLKAEMRRLNYWKNK
ncbi:MAG: hypothetical protein H6907_03255 [Hyphomicrobiales bacterium]|nr:hypothetical protein [Hyphomicrobiales bacterium]MCP5370725.1 hypothetical protein [Hyphomicrobiales bacterium]